MSQIEFRQKAMSAGMIVLFFVGWELFCVVTHMSDLVLPRPSQVFVTLFQKFPILWPHILQTLATTMIGIRARRRPRCRARRRDRGFQNGL